MGNGARVPDPQGTTFSHERVGTNSTFETLGPAGEFQTWKPDVPHGVVSKIEYWSSALGQKRVATVYTPPGYMNGGERYPVLYLVHGAGDSYDSWTSVGHAHLILDNLIAAGKARPMIVVMPFGHTPDRPGGNMLANTDFGDDLIKSLIPYVDGTFRTLANQPNRAMAGLSMGGSHTIRFGLTHPELFDHIGIFSMGLGMQGPADVTAYEAANDAALRQAAKDLDLVYYAMGKDDFLYGTVAPTRANRRDERRRRDVGVDVHRVLGERLQLDGAQIAAADVRRDDAAVVAAHDPGGLRADGHEVVARRLGIEVDHAVLVAASEHADLVPLRVGDEADQERLPLAACVPVILLANAVCYGLGYAVFVGASYLLSN